MQEAVLRKRDVGEVLRILKAGFDVNAPIGCGTYSALDGAVQVHLALLHHGRVETLRFSVDELESFASKLEKELQEMDEFGDSPPMVLS